MKTKKQIYRLALLFTVGGALLISFGLSLLYNLTNSNIVYFVTVIPDIINVWIDLSETAVFAVGFSLLFYAAFCGKTFREACTVFAIFLGAALIRRLGDLCVALLLFGVLDTADIVNNAIFFILDALLGITALLIAKRRVTRIHREAARADSGSSLFGDVLPDTPADIAKLYPFKKIVGKENPLQFCSLIMGSVLSAEKILFRLLFDIDYGMPESFGEVMIMVVFYASDILIGIIFYCISVLVYHQLFRQKKTKELIK